MSVLGGYMNERPELLKAYRKGSKKAYETIYMEYEPIVRRFVKRGFSFSSQGRLCSFKGHGDSSDTDCVVQETFLRVFSEAARQGYDGIRPFKNYVLSIAKHEILGALRRKERVFKNEMSEEGREAIAQAHVHESFNGTIKRPDAGLLKDELSDITRSFLETLDEEEKVFFRIRFVVGETQMASAKRMACTRARIKLLEKRLRTAFLAHLRHHGYFESYTPKARWTRKEGLAA